MNGLLNLRGGWAAAPRHPLVHGRFEVIRPYVSGRDVLDCGCIGDRPEDLLLHERIRGEARSCLGVDMNEEKVRELVRDGFDVACADVESMSLGRRFDVVVAGELIEHLGNPGLFLERAREHLHDSGVLILTTPNPYFLPHVIRVFFRRKPSINPGHRAWYCASTLPQLLHSYGFRVESMYWCQYRSRWWINLLVRLRPGIARGIIAVASKAQA